MLISHVLIIRRVHVPDIDNKMTSSRTQSDQRAAAVSTRGVVDVTVLIVNYNVREFLEQALLSVMRSSDRLEVEVIVVDNNSVDGSQELVHRAFPEVRLIANDRNAGFGAANNVGFAEAKGRYLMILNPDTIIQEDTLATLVDFMDAHPEAGAAGCKILNPDGTFARESRRAFPTPATAFYRMIGLSRLLPGSRRFGRYNLSYLSPEEVCEVDALSGSCMILRREALVTTASPGQKVDQSTSARPDRLFDENFFMYGEDLDLCYRIQKAGWKIFYVPDTQIIHYKGESTRKGDLRYVRLFYGAMLLFADKHFRERSAILRFGLRCAILARASLSAVRRGVRRAARPLLDFALVYVSIVLVAAFYLGSGLNLGWKFFLSTPLSFGLATVAGIRLGGGYERGRQRLRPVVIGLMTGFFFVAALSFFVKEIAFSRFIVVGGLVPAALFLAAWRAIANRRSPLVPVAVVVGDALEAARLRSMVASRLRPPFVVAGYVTADDGAEDIDIPLRRLGSVEQLRDVIRLYKIDEVIFATEGLSNRTLLTLMRKLRDLPVEFKTFLKGGSHVIGKARVEDLSLPLLSTEETYGRPGAAMSSMRVRLLALILTISLIPWVALLSRVRPRTRWSTLHNRVRHLPRVVAGRLALVGRRPADPFTPPAHWDIPEGVFSVGDSLSGPQSQENADLAWQFYLDNQTPSLEMSVASKAVRRILSPDRE